VTPRNGIRLALTAVCVAATLAVPATAGAGLLTGLLGGGGSVGSILYVVDDLVDGLLTGRTALSAADCPPRTIVQPFVPFGDTADYFLTPGGDMTAGPWTWAFQYGAAIVPGSNPFNLSGSSDSTVLRVPAGGSAVSPKLCVGRDDPTLRFVARSSGSSPSLRIDALFLGTSGEVRSDYVGTLTGVTGWTPTRQIQIHTSSRAAVGDKTAIAFVFTAQRGSWDVDDLFVDPYRSR
jgi:hypothetical protein